MGFLFSVSFLFEHCFIPALNCQDKSLFRMKEVVFSNKTEMITAIHLWKGISGGKPCSSSYINAMLLTMIIRKIPRYSVRSAPCSIGWRGIGVLRGQMSVSSCMILNL
jgi:hypothetical protein